MGRMTVRKRAYVLADNRFLGATYLSWQWKNFSKASPIHQKQCFKKAMEFERKSLSQIWLSIHFSHARSNNFCKEWKKEKYWLNTDGWLQNKQMESANREARYRRRSLERLSEISGIVARYAFTFLSKPSFRGFTIDVNAPLRHIRGTLFLK